jgi:hypothetical protein
MWRMEVAKMLLDQRLVDESDDLSTIADRGTCSPSLRLGISSAEGSHNPNARPAKAESANDAVVQAKLLEESGYAAVLAIVGGPGLSQVIGSTGYSAYRDRFVQQAGNPSDPMERLALEQLLLAHLHIGQLHANATNAQSVEAARMYLGMACRMRSEFRRLLLALDEHRSPKRSTFTVVKQANLAAGDQQIALVDRTRKSSKKDSLRHKDAQLGNKPMGTITNDRQIATYSKSETRSRRAAEPAQVARHHRGRSAAAPRSRTAK